MCDFFLDPQTHAKGALDLAHPTPPSEHSLDDGTTCAVRVLASRSPLFLGAPAHSWCLVNICRKEGMGARPPPCRAAFGGPPRSIA